jgi:excisionase family DNA binding protein
MNDILFQFGMRENTASSRQHASCSTVESSQSQVENSQGGLNHSDLPTTMQSKGTTGGEKAETSDDNAHRHERILLTKRMPDFEPLLGSEDAARLLGNIHIKTLQRYARQGSVPGYRIGGHWYFRTTELDAWLRSRINLNRQSVR